MIEKLVYIFVNHQTDFNLNDVKIYVNYINL